MRLKKLNGGTQPVISLAGQVIQNTATFLPIFTAALLDMMGSEFLI